jgi:hypothetical protein
VRDVEWVDERERERGGKNFLNQKDFLSKSTLSYCRRGKSFAPGAEANSIQLAKLKELI